MPVETLAEIESLTPEQLRETVETIFNNNQQLVEHLAAVNQMLAREDIGWSKLSGSEEDGGLSLDELKDWSKQLREAVVGNPHMKRGATLRRSYVWDGGIHYSNIPQETRGRGPKPQQYINLPYNQKTFFGNTAREERETCLYTDSIIFYLGDDKKKTLEPIVLEQITGEYRNPDNSAEIWAYRREWSRYNAATNKTTAEKVWYFTDIFKDKIPAGNKIKNASGELENVDPDFTLFDGSVNTQTGWAYGVPDALPALAWARIYKDFLLNGKIMSDALATFAFKATVGTKRGADNVALKMATATTPGSTATVGGVNDLVPMSSAGKGYAFETGTPLAAVVATAIEVSVIHLTSDPGTAGASYGSASTLDLPTRLSVKSRRQWHIDYDKRVLRWLGAPDADVDFLPMIDFAEALRELQADVLRWTTGLYEAKEMKAKIEGVDETHVKVPDGVLLPNNRESWERSDIDPKDGPASSQTTSSPGQGQSTAAGDTNLGNDIRNRGVEGMKRQLAVIAQLIEEMEKAA